MNVPLVADAFRDALARFASGVTIVAARHPSGLVGFTATAFSALSLSPPLVLACVGKKASAYDRIVTCEHVGVSILDERQAPIAAQFARSGIDRFAGIPLSIGTGYGVPLIEGSLAALECRRHALHDAGDHTIFVAEVLAASVSAGSPLLHFGRRFGAFVADPAARSGASRTITREREQGA
ncbi:MAG: flavin reductase family protein [Polyangiaceae bacterium]|jgi:flavin reductase (DIM6/NTAB) family NADH-FMN oxidoreductase RutF